MGDTQTPTTVMPLTTSEVPMDKELDSQIHHPSVNGTSEDPPLFSSHLISPEVASLLPEGYSIRPLRRGDFHTGEP